MLLAIELLDEWVFGVREAAWPLLRADFHLSYAAIGLLITVPALFGSLVQPLFGLLANAGHRRLLVLGGGVLFAGALVFLAGAWGALPLLLGFLLLDPASGAFVSLSQAVLIDAAPDDHEQSMARWELFGAVGVLLGPLTLAAALALGFGWRPVLLALAVLTVPLIFFARAVPESADGDASLHSTLRAALAALRRPRVLRWLILLELTDLLGDVFLGFLALYLVDVAHLTAPVAAAAVAIWSVAGLAGDGLLLLLLRRFSGAAYLRTSAALALIALPAFLLTPGVAPKLALVAVLALLRAGWYALPKARLYGELPGTSGVAVSLADASGLIGRLSPLLIGLLAQQIGLGHALWLALLAPIGILVAFAW